MTINTAETVGRTERVTTWADRAQFAGLASVGAGASTSPPPASTPNTRPSRASS